MFNVIPPVNTRYLFRKFGVNVGILLWVCAQVYVIDLFIKMFGFFSERFINRSKSVRHDVTVVQLGNFVCSQDFVENAKVVYVYRLVSSVCISTIPAQILQ